MQDKDTLRDTVLQAIEESLDAQLRAVRRLRRSAEAPSTIRAKTRLSQVDMAHEVLVKAGKPLHITELLRRIEHTFQVGVDRESLVSALTKKVMRGDRFTREDKSTFFVKELLP